MKNDNVRKVFYIKDMEKKEKKIPVSRSKSAFKERERERKEKERAEREKAKAVMEENLADENETQENETQETEKKPFSWKLAAGILAGVVITGAAGYVGMSMKYQNTYLPGTCINGMNAAGMSPKAVEEAMAKEAGDYSLRLVLRNDASENIEGSAIGLNTVFDGSLENILKQQNPYTWPIHMIKGENYEIETMLAYEDEALDQAVDSLNAMDPAYVTAPVDAHLSDYIKGEGYSVIPETEGDQLKPEKVKEEVKAAINDLKEEIDLDELGCYEEPAVRSDDESLTAMADSLNHYVNMTVTYTMGSKNEILDGEQIHTWLSYSDGQVTVDEGKISEYVKSLASKYNTAYTKRTFKTSYGPEVEVSGVYGWRIDQQAEAAALKEALAEGKNVTKEPAYAQKAASHDGNDYGNTYAEVNLTAQHMYCYKDGKKILESDFVSGNVSKGYTTPPGLFSLTYKQRDATLKGQGYASPVKFWMPFNGGIGFHDASWRNTFGGTIYKKNGSHGCVNMPYAAAKTLFENVYAGMPVICYNLAGTENAQATNASGKDETAVPAQTAPAVQPTQAPAETPAQTPAQTQPPETQAPTVKPAGPGETTKAAEKTQAPTQPSSDPAVIQPVETPAPGENGSKEVGPAFSTTAPADEIGPGV